MGKQCKLYRHNRFKFVYTLKSSGEACYRCTISKCTASIYINENGIIREGPAQHRHTDSVRDMTFEVLRSRCKLAATQNFEARPSTVVRSQLRNLPDTTTLQSADLRKCKTVMYKERRKHLPTFPKSLVESIDNIKHVPLSTSRNEDFLLCAETLSSDSGVIIFTCQSNLRALCRSEILLGDGTFYITPRFFYQVYTIHAYVDGHYFPLVYSLLPNKSASTYTIMLTKIVEQCERMGLEFSPRLVLLDFETAPR